MKIFIGLVILAVGLVFPVQGQQVGQSEQVVRQALGNPMAVRKTDERNTWLYSEGRRVVFEKGVVVSASGFPEASEVGSGPEKRPPEGGVNPAPRSSVSEVHSLPVKKPTAIEAKGISRNSDLKAQWGVIFLGFALVVSGICGILILIEAFRVSVLWGLAVLFFPIAQFIFVATHWSETKKPFLIGLCVTVLFGAAGLALKA